MDKKLYLKICLTLSHSEEDERRENRDQNRLEILWKYFKPWELRTNDTFNIYSFVHTRIRLPYDQTVSLLQGF